MELKSLADLLRPLATSQHLMTPGDERELQNLVAELDRNGARSVSDLLSIVSKAWPPPKQPKKRPPAPAADPATFVKKLDAARDNPSEFDTLLDELTKSKALKAADVAAIANRFRGSSKKYRARAAAVDDIRKAWLENRRDIEKAARIKEIF